MDSYIITTERLELRKWIKGDIQPFAKMNNDKTVMKYFPKTLTTDETIAMVQRINLHFEKHQFGLFAVENKATQKFIGYTGFTIPGFESFFTPCIEIGWRYEKESWGNGFATEAARACLKYGFNELKLDTIVSFTASVNTSSEKVMKKIGMTYIANFDHPKLEKDSILCRHVLYEIKKQQRQKS